MREHPTQTPLRPLSQPLHAVPAPLDPESQLPRPSLPDMIEQVAQAHALYSQLTGQNLSLRFDRERAWYELLRAGYTCQDVLRVVRYLQQEIRAGRRNVGALKLSNLLQLDRFEEDLNISRIRLRSPGAAATPPSPPPPSTELSTEQKNQGRQRALELLAKLRAEQGL